MLPLPPGTILQLMYLNERLSKLKPGSFIEVGPGSGEVSNVLLKKGWRGCAYDLEDEIAGHFRRYDIDRLKSLMEAVNYDLIHTKGLTFPISNFLLPISNYLVRKSESVKIGLSNLEKTKRSGIRDVSFKTKFPSFLGIFLNEIFLLPFYWFQKIPFFTSKSLVLFFEVKPNLEKH